MFGPFDIFENVFVGARIQNYRMTLLNHCQCSGHYIKMTKVASDFWVYIYMSQRKFSFLSIYTVHKCSNESHDFPNAFMSSRSILSEEQWHHDLSRPRWNHIYYSPAPNSSNTLLVITTFEKAKTYTFIINSSLANFWTFPLTHTTLIDHEQQWNSPILDFCYSQDQANAP